MALTADDMQTWHISYRDGRPDESVRAAYPAKDAGLDGWVTLKDWRHKIVAMVPEASAALIQRCPNDPEAVGTLMARLVGNVRATGCLPRELEGGDDAEAGRHEVALRTQALAALMRDRIDAMGAEGYDFYVYLADIGRMPDTAQFSIDYLDDDAFGPKLHLMLTGYEPPRLVEIPEDSGLPRITGTRVLAPAESGRSEEKKPRG
jgi:hypothetical protein